MNSYQLSGVGLIDDAEVDDDTTMGVVSPEEPALTSACPEKDPRWIQVWIDRFSLRSGSS